MGRVELRGNVLVVVFNDGSSRTSGIQVTAAMDEAQIGQAISRAKSTVAGYYYGLGDDAHAGEAERASGNARAMYRSLHPEAQPAQPPREERRTPPREERRTPPREERRDAPREERRAPREERRETRQATPRRVFPERAEDVREWVERQLRDSRRDDRRAQTAASVMHQSRNYLEQYLDAGPQRGVLRTNNQREVTMAVFNSLYQIPTFRLFLSSAAASERANFPEFNLLQGFLTEPGRGEQLSEQASAEIMRAADMYVRYFLFAFVADNPNYSRYREEIGQLPTGNWRLTNIAGTRTFQALGGRQPSDADRAALMKLYLSGPIDADTVTASCLYIRRWSQEHPESGRARTQDQIAAWSAPAVTPLEGQPAVPQTGAEEWRRRPNVAIIGASDIAGDRIGTTLQSVLRATIPEARVASSGVSGQSTGELRRRFQADVLANRPNVVIISASARINEGDANVTATTTNLADMIDRARQAGAQVIVLGILPWNGHTRWTAERQRACDQVNAWLRARTDITFIDVVPIVGEGNPSRPRSIYDSGDHLHLNSDGRDAIARAVAQQVFGAQQTRDQARSALQDFADRNWPNLARELFTNAQSGNPAGIITLSRQLPEGQPSLEAALRALGRDDMERVFDRVFNEVMHRDPDFIAWCRGHRDYGPVARESIALTPSSSPTDRRLMIRAMQEYLNHVATSTGQEWYGRFRDDLRLLNREALRLSRDDVMIEPLSDIKTLAAIALYSWRKANQTADVGAWGASLNIRARRSETQPVQPPPQQVQPPPGEQRRRVIRP
ncbi:MAG: GDSL-type esterase/lipase family protein [Candidatus Micrarchaeota archaeon]